MTAGGAGQAGGGSVPADPAPLSSLTGQPKAAPEVFLFPPSREQIDTGKATVVCLLSNFYPDNVQVSWFADGNRVSSGAETSLAQRQSNNRYMASSYLTMTSSEWNSHESYQCKVVHEAGNVEKTLNRSECS